MLCFVNRESVKTISHAHPISELGIMIIFSSSRHKVIISREKLDTLGAGLNRSRILGEGGALILKKMNKFRQNKLVQNDIK